ncbi:hypothetical protein [Chitinophaga rhizophila]|uniref:Uncharacterized protein n=1 Tax=Chitinophaga rhizophila TaxID=2866212 RepID=A0ABS7GJ26_9BACT|nr:hypothetical protein [Chitinophaga rhizophila]MBW8687225.1 hypothetical protein [Chitinophaga rhizophila]
MRLTQLAPGEQITIVDSSLAGLSCGIVAHDGMGKFIVWTGFMKRDLLMTVPEAYLRVFGVVQE